MMKRPIDEYGFADFNSGPVLNDSGTITNFTSGKMRPKIGIDDSEEEPELFDVWYDIED